MKSILNNINSFCFWVIQQTIRDLKEVWQILSDKWMVFVGPMLILVMITGAILSAVSKDDIYKVHSVTFYVNKGDNFIAFHNIATENFQAVLKKARSHGYALYVGTFNEPHAVWCDANAGHFNGGNGITQISCETDEKGVISNSQVIEEGDPSTYAKNLLSQLLKDINRSQ